MKGQTYLILSVIILIIVSVFAVTNMAIVDVNYFFWSSESPLILVILFSVLMGVLISVSVSAHRFIQMQREIKNLKEKNAQMEDILSNHDLLSETDESTE